MPTGPWRRLALADSTQAEAFRAAAEGAPDGFVVTADVQTAGHGRLGRVWIAPPGTSVLCSVLLRPALPPARWPWLSLAAGLAVAEALAELGVEPRLKWPNDVLIGARKVAGVLLEGRPADGILVVGIGINVLQRAFPPELAPYATSLGLALGRSVDRDGLLASTLLRLQYWRERLEAGDTRAVATTWAARSETIGRPWHAPGQPDRLALGIDDDGALLVRGDDGTVCRIVAAGEVAELTAGVPGGA